MDSQSNFLRRKAYRVGNNTYSLSFTFTKVREVVAKLVGLGHSDS